ncbi:MAG: hypothetical protein RL747_1049 [Bacteroidota bacterium]
MLTLMIFLPLLGFVINGTLGKFLPKAISGGLGTAAVFGSFILALMSFMDLSGAVPAVAAVHTKLFTFLHVGGFHVDFAFQFDRLSAVMTLIITGIGTLIHLYSIAYMHEDEGFYKFFAYLNLFIFNMLVLVLGANYLMLFFGWEGVGLCSYLLIGFWYKNVNYGKAARKAFIMNRIGDLGLLMGLFLIYDTYGTFEYQDLFAKVFAGSASATGVNTAIALLLFIGAMGKSAQIPLYTWLPDAMAGPTPVSALIHAATMVTAGIYLVIRSEAIYALSPIARDVVMWIGLATSLMAALIGLKQNDIKKVLAYSTVSQLGLMFIALGCGAYTAALFHVITHAFFKALLFLGSGSVIHGMHHEQDIREMGGLRKKMPITYLTFLIGTLAITGFPFLSGFFSKDEILMSAFAHNKLVFGLALISAGITGFYMFRMFFVTFHGTYRNHHHPIEKVHESPLLMTLPLMILAVLSVVGGVINLPHYLGESISGGLHHWLSDDGLGHFSPILMYPEHAIELSHTAEIGLLAMAVSVFVIAFLYTRNKYVVKGAVPESDADQMGMGKVLANKFYVDEAYDTAFVSPIEAVGDVVGDYVDEKGVKGLVDGVGSGSNFVSRTLSKIQNGNIEYYLVYMVIGVALLLAFNLF